ncbi:MAG: hypothetical protein KDA96_03765, partial [Planctomycetaceae bacterium]|nr:hypothetical protein [Planctomycetaceae bacterium]
FGNDLIFGDHGEVTGNIQLSQIPLDTFTPAFSFTSIATLVTDAGGTDFISAGAGEDIVIGGQDHDRILGEAGDDDIIGGHNVADGSDADDYIDGGSGNDVIAGDNAYLHREPRVTDTRWRTLSGTQILEVSGNGAVNTAAQADPAGVAKRTVTLFNHTATTVTGVYGNDAIAGGADNDMIFGQLGDDAIQGDGAMLTSLGNMIYDIALTHLSADDYDGTGSDGDDYVEGGGGNDVILGNLGQDDLIGGSSALFGTPTATHRPDGQDIIFGGSGTRAARNDLGDLTPDGHGRDADVILGDNGNIFRVVGINGVASAGHLQYNWDIYGGQHVIPRTTQYLEYAFGDASNAAFNDELHGESGDDTIHGMSGNDVIFGDGQDDDLIGGAGNDRIFGGAGEDGILGDDGRIFTSRNGLTEPLNGILTAAVQAAVNIPSTVIGAMTNVSGRLKKEVDLAAYYVGGNDIVYGGLGDDFIHGGAGDDALSGAEATSVWFITTAQTGGSILGYNSSTRMFADYRPGDSLAKINGFVLNFESSSGGMKINDGMDNIFGDEGNDWLVGGTQNDRMFGGMGDDLLNADDNLETDGGLNRMIDPAEYADADFAYGGAGLDVLIANTGADRLIDWVKNFNTYVVPIDPTPAGVTIAAPTVIRDPSSALVNLLRALARSGGIDTDVDATANLLDTEMGLFTIEDDNSLWQANTWIGLPRDPAAAALQSAIDTIGAYETLATPGIIVATTETLQVSENGTSRSIWVSLTSAPAANVRVNVSSTDTSEFTVNASILTFTPTNWLIPQQLTITGVDDFIADGTQSENLQLIVDQATAPTGWATVNRSLAISVTDNDVSVATITGPTAVTLSQRPTITWTAVPGAAGYDVWISSVSTRTNPWLRATAGSNSFTPSADLGIGTFDVWIQAIMPDGTRWAWSTMHRFRIETPVVMTAPTFLQDTSRPTFSWQPLAGAVRYDVWINNTTTGQTAVVREMNVTSTTWQVPGHLPISNYRIWVRGIDAGGRGGQWSTMETFRVSTPPAPVGPLTSTFDRTPTFEWGPVPGALSYTLSVKNLQTGVEVHRIAGLTTLSWTPTVNLPDATYRWQVVAVGQNSLPGSWSAPIDFYVGGRPEFITSPGIYGTSPAIQWTGVGGAARYEIQIDRTDVPQNNLIHLSNLTTNSFTPSNLVSGGSYRMWVRAVSTTGEIGIWSSMLTFSVAQNDDANEQYRLTSLRSALIQTLPADPLEPTTNAQSLPAQSSTHTVPPGKSTSNQSDGVVIHQMPELPLLDSTPIEIQADAQAIDEVIEFVLASLQWGNVDPGEMQTAQMQ